MTAQGVLVKHFHLFEIAQGRTGKGVGFLGILNALIIPFYSCRVDLPAIVKEHALTQFKCVGHDIFRNAPLRSNTGDGTGVHIEIE